MSETKNIKWERPNLRWETDGQLCEAFFKGDIENVLALKGGGLAVIERNNGVFAKILNDDGSLRVDLVNPFRREAGVEFYYFNYVADQLVLILAGAVRDFACNVNELTGELSPPLEAR